MGDLRLELRCRNNALYRAIFDTHANVAAFCRVHNFSQQLVGELLNLSASPFRSRGKGAYRPMCLAIAEAVGMSAEELFPASLYSASIPHLSVAEVDSTRFRPLTAARRMALPPAQDLVDKQDLMKAIRDAIGTLPPRYQRVIALRFGLDDGNERTLRDVGREIGVTPERVRTIEKRALMHMRRVRQRPLRAFLEDFA